MKKEEVIEFFDRCAPWWDDELVLNEKIVEVIFDNGGVKEGIHVLDVASGTGALFPSYQSREVASVTGIDISPEMVKIAQRKFPEMEVICGDVENVKFEKQFDSVMVYNAFPHFPNPSNLLEVLAGLVKKGGKLSIAHGMSRKDLMKHHMGAAKKVSLELPDEKEMATLLEPYFDVDVVISNDEMYQVVGVRR